MANEAFIDVSNFVPTFISFQFLDHRLDFRHGFVHDGVQLWGRGQLVDLEGPGGHRQLINTVMVVVGS